VHSPFDFRVLNQTSRCGVERGFYQRNPPRCGLLKQSSEKARSLPESAVANIRRVDARKDAKVAAVAQSADNDWWSWALIAVIFAISAAAVWGPVIAGAI
jgi:hypothetical protein